MMKSVATVVVSPQERFRARRRGHVAPLLGGAQLGKVHVGQRGVGFLEIRRLVESGAQFLVPGHILQRGSQIERPRLIFQCPAVRFLLDGIERLEAGELGLRLGA